MIKFTDIKAEISKMVSGRNIPYWIVLVYCELKESGDTIGIKNKELAIANSLFFGEKLVEAAGIEPASGNASTGASTYLSCD